MCLESLSNRHTPIMRAGTRVAYLGPPGTYSHEAALKSEVGSSLCEYVACQSLSEVVNQVAVGNVDRGVLPVENSTNGMVAAAWDALAQYIGKYSIIGSTDIPVRHQLYGKVSRSSLESVDTVFSHPQVWGQTRRWLAENLAQAKQVDASSTADAVEQALRTPNSVAIAGPACGDVCGIEPLVTDVADEAGNSTRFLVLGQYKEPAVSEIAVATSLSSLEEILRAGGAQFLAVRPSQGLWEHIYIVQKATAPARL